MAIEQSRALALLAALTFTGSVQYAQEESAEVPTELEEAEPARSPRDQAIWILRSIREPEPPLADPVADLTKLVALTADDLVSYLRDRRVPALEDEPSQTLSIYQHELILDALSQSEPATTMAATSRMLTASSGGSAVAAAIEVYGATGESGQLSTIRALLAGLEEEQWSKRLERSLQQAVASIIRGDYRAQGLLLSSWRDWKPEHLTGVIRGIGASRDPRGLEFLGEILYWEPDHVHLALSQVRLLGPSRVEFIDKPITETVREMLDTEDARIRKAALLALGDLQDLESVPRMIEILSEEGTGERENAVWALQRITGVRLNDQAQTWKTWFDMESKWYSRVGTVMAKLSSPDDADVFGAIRELSTHYLHKDELAQAVSECLTHSNPKIRATACKGLARLKSSVAVPVLISRLDDRDERVQFAARKALISLTGEERGPYSEDWEELRR